MFSSLFMKETCILSLEFKSCYVSLYFTTLVAAMVRKHSTSDHKSNFYVMLLKKKSYYFVDFHCLYFRIAGSNRKETRTQQPQIICMLCYWYKININNLMMFLLLIFIWCWCKSKDTHTQQPQIICLFCIEFKI